MRKIILYIGVLLTVSLNISAKTVESSNLIIKWSTVSDENNVQLKVIEEGQKKGVVVVRQEAIEPSGEVVINFSYLDEPAGNDKMHRITAYKLQTLTSDMSHFFGFVRIYVNNLKLQYPQRFVVQKRTCANRITEFFQCLYEEKENWNVIIYINNGEISLNLIPVIDEKTEKLIGGAFMVSYTVGTGRYFNRTA